MSVWDDLVGQQRAVQVLQRAVGAAHRSVARPASTQGQDQTVGAQPLEAAGANPAGGTQAMSHAWLFTGPPGSGRSNAARAFAAALQCTEGEGCGQCKACRTSLAGSHPDVTLVRTERLSIGVDEVRDLVRRAAMSPTLGRFQVIVVEDADRVTDRGADALLKAIEEPARRTVWVLCAPHPDEVIVTIRSRTRQLRLATPTDAEVARLLVERDHVDPAMAAFAARAAQGHVGRARALARDESARIARHEILRLPGRLTSVGACLDAAAQLIKRSADEAARITERLDADEKAELSRALGVGTKGARQNKSTTAALRDLDDEHKARAKRLQRDALDRVLTELTTLYRDVLGLQTGAMQTGLDALGSAATGLDADGLDESGPHLINGELGEELTRAARGSTPEQTLWRIDAILHARESLEANVAPLLAMEALLVSLANPAVQIR